MSSQPLAFAELLGGGILLTAGITGHSVKDVLAGNISPIQPLTKAVEKYTVDGSGEGSEKDSAFTQAQGGKASKVSGRSPSRVPTTHKAAEALKGIGNFEGTQVALWIIPYLKYARAHGWTGSISSGYRSEAEQERIYNSGVRPAAVPGTSNHEGKAFPRGAIDVTDAEQLSHILENMPGGSLLKWAGSADPVHFSFPHGGGY